MTDVADPRVSATAVVKAETNDPKRRVTCHTVLAWKVWEAWTGWRSMDVHVAELTAAELMAGAADLMSQAASALERGDVSAATALDRRAAEMRRRALRAASASEESVLPGSPAGSGDIAGRRVPLQRTPRTVRSLMASVSERQLVVDCLYELDAVATAALLGQYAVARFGQPVQPKRLSSIRRDDRRASDRGAARPPFIVPALDGRRFEPARAQLALSTWPLPRRIMGPRSGRVELLRASLSVIAQLRWRADQGPSAADRPQSSELMLNLLRDLSRSITGTTVDGYGDIDAAEIAIRREYTELEPMDQQWRGEAAARARRQLTDTETVWGTGPLRAVKDRTS